MLQLCNPGSGVGGRMGRHSEDLEGPVRLPLSLPQEPNTLPRV
jgi:hypothetical protein